MFSLARKALVQVIMPVRAPFYVFLSAVVLRRCWSGSPPTQHRNGGHIMFNRGNPAVCASSLRQRYRGVMTALPRAACIMPTIRGAWQIGWIFSNGQAERLRRYSPLCYVAPILPAQPPLKVRYHALTAFPSAHSCDLEEPHQTEKGDRHDAANAKRIPNPHG